MGDAQLEAPPDTPAVSAELAIALAGRWGGTLELPGQSLRLAFVIAVDADGKLSATFDSPDQGQTAVNSSVSVRISCSGPA